MKSFFNIAAPIIIGAYGFAYCVTNSEYFTDYMVHPYTLTTALLSGIGVIVWLAFGLADYLDGN